MSHHETALVVFKVITIVTSVMTRFSLLPDFQRMYKTKSTGNMSVLPSVSLYANCYLLCWYSFAVDNIIPLLFTSSLGLLVGGILAVFFYIWTVDKHEVLKIITISLVVMALETIYSVMALLGWTKQDRSSIGTTLGILLIVSSIGFYASPMATIRHVIRTKTSSSMPFTMGVVNVMSSVSWVVYGILIDDIFIVIPNVCGTLLGSIQLLLTCIYPRKEPTTDERRLSALTSDKSLVFYSHEDSKSGLFETLSFAMLKSPTQY